MGGGQLLATTQRPLQLVKFLIGQLWRILVKLLSLLLILLPRQMRLASGKKLHELPPTAYLDAVRGYAAWIVYNSHVIPPRWRRTDGPFMRYSAFQALYMGPVEIFFVISGFALTYRALGHMHNKQPVRVLESLASSIFRRHFRLYLPLIWASFVTMLALASGIAVNGNDPPVLQPTLLGNISFWIADTVRSCDPFPHVVSWWSKGVRVTHTDYIPQAWTIPVEYRGSMLIFMFCIAVCRMDTRKRMWTTLVCSALCFWWTTPYAGLFLFGMWLADRRHVRTRQQQEATALPMTTSTAGPELQSTAMITKETEDAIVMPVTEKSDSMRRGRVWSVFQRLGGSSSSRVCFQEPSLLQQTPYIVMFCLAICLLTSPDPLSTTSPFPYNLVAWTYPPNWRKNYRSMPHWPLSIGAIMTCYSLEHAPLLQKPFLTQFSQFLGELSFGFYIMHQLIRWIVWDRFFVPWQIAHFGTNHWFQLPGYILMTILVIWAAEVFLRVDMVCIRMTRKLQDVMFTG